MQKIAFGVSLNNRAAVFLDTFSISDLVEMSQLAEEFSFHSVWVGDSLIDSPRYEPIALLGAVAATTKRIKIGGSIIQPHFRNPIMLALSWATLDRLSKGRTILTLGIGGGTPQGVKKEAELVGIDVKLRGSALEENVKILRNLWSGQELDHQGEVYKLRGAKLGYLPIQTHPPIWIAAGIFVPPSNEKVSATPGYTKGAGSYVGPFNRVAKLADGWFTIMSSPEEFERSSRLISDLAEKNGRDPKEITRSVECWINIDDDRSKARRNVTDMIERYFSSSVDPETVERWSIYGTVDDCIEKIERYRKAGAELIKFVMGDPDQIGLMKRVGKSIMGSF